MSKGFITIERAIWDHPVFKPSPMTEREAFIWMIKEAAWKDTKHRVGSEIIDVPRGSFVFTLRDLQSAFMWSSDKKVRGFLGRLEAEGIIGRTAVGATNARKTHVTICKYDEYQTVGRTKDAPRTHEGTHRGRTGDAVKEPYNHITKDTSVSSEASAKPKAKRGTRLPENWSLPDEWLTWALSEGWPESVVRLEAEKFRDFWVSKAGAGGVKLDWQATWRNWMRNSKSPKTINGGGYERTNHSQERVAAFVRGAAGA